MSVSVSTQRAIDSLIPPGTPLFGVKMADLMALPIAVIYHAARAQSVTFAPGLTQIQWTGTIDDEPFVAVWHVNRSLAMVALNSRLRTVPMREFFGFLRRANYRS